MTRATKSLSGGGKDKFIKAVIAAEQGVDPQAAARLGEVLINAVAEVRVRREAWDTYSKPGPGEKGRKGAKARAAAEAAAKQAPVKPSAASAAAAAAAPSQPFDPFAFSAVAVLTRKGKDALAAELAKIGSADNLKAIATAQHLAIDPAILEIDSLRAALVVATERRIAERRAAAG